MPKKKKIRKVVIVAIFNQSGGVGKSTLTMNLGYHLSLRKQKVLLVDMDPQGSLTDFMGLDPWELEQTIYQSIMLGDPLPIHCDMNGVDLVPSNVDLCGAEAELIVADMRETRLKKALAKIQEQYNFILIDCPPSLGVLSYISLVAATHILVPIQAQYKALRGTGLLFKTIQRVRAGANPELQIAGFVPTMYEGHKSQHGRSLDSIQSQLGQVSTVFPVIPSATAFADSQEEHKPLALYDPKHPIITPPKDKNGKSTKKKEDMPFEVLTKGVLSLA